MVWNENKALTGASVSVMPPRDGEGKKMGAQRTKTVKNRGFFGSAFLVAVLLDARRDQPLREGCGRLLGKGKDYRVLWGGSMFGDAAWEVLAEQEELDGTSGKRASA